MKSIYDLVTLILFAGLAILYLQRSIEQARDKTIHYLPPAIGCAAANWLGDHDQPVLAGIVILAGLVYTWYVLKPFQQKL